MSKMFIGLIVVIFLFIFVSTRANDKYLYVFYSQEKCDFNIQSASKVIHKIRKDSTSSGGYLEIKLSEYPIESIQFDLIKREDSGFSSVAVHLSSGIMSVNEMKTLSDDNLIYYYDQKYAVETWSFNKLTDNFLSFTIDKKNKKGELKENIKYRVNSDKGLREWVKKIGNQYEETAVYKKDKLVESSSKKDGLVIYEVKNGDGIFCISNDGKSPNVLCDIKNGLKNGEYKSFVDQGVLFSFPIEIRTYKNNILNGPYLLYNKKGVLEIKGSYLENKPVGVWHEFVFDEDGKLLETINTKKD